MLASVGRTPEAFEAETREQILLEKLNRFLSESVFVGDGEVEEDFASRSVKARVEYVLLPPPEELPGSVTDAETEAYFKANSANYLQGEKRKAKYLLVETAKIRAGIRSPTPTSEGVQRERRHLSPERGDPGPSHPLQGRRLATRTRRRARRPSRPLRKLKAGADFEALARAESDDPGSKASGGELGVFDRGRMVKEFEDAAFGAEPKQIVGPVKTAFGYHVIQVRARRSPARPAPLRGVVDHPRAPHGEARGGRGAPPREGSLREDRQDVEAVRRRLRKLATGPVTFNETEFLSRTDAAAGLGPNPEFSSVLFALKPGEVSPPVATARGEAIVKLAETRPSGVPPFAEVKARVVADLTRKKQEETAVLATLGKSSRRRTALSRRPRRT